MVHSCFGHASPTRMGRTPSWQLIARRTNPVYARTVALLLILVRRLGTSTCWLWQRRHAATRHAYAQADRLVIALTAWAVPLIDIYQHVADEGALLATAVPTSAAALGASYHAQRMQLTSPDVDLRRFTMPAWLGHDDTRSKLLLIAAH